MLNAWIVRLQIYQQTSDLPSDFGFTIKTLDLWIYHQTLDLWIYHQTLDLPSDVGFAIRLWIYHQILDLPSDLNFSGPIFLIFILLFFLLYFFRFTGVAMPCELIYYPVLSLLTVSRCGLRVSAKCLNCKLLPEDSKFISRLQILYGDLPADKLTTRHVSLAICYCQRKLTSQHQCWGLSG